MQSCGVCQSIANFICECSSNTTFLCKYHVLDHEVHSQLKFFLTKNLENNFQAVYKHLENTKVEINLIEDSLAESKKTLIASINKAYSEISSKLNQSNKEIDNALKLLKELKLDVTYNYLSIMGFLLDPDKLQKNSMIRFEDRTSLLQRKIGLNLKIESLTNNLMKRNDFCFDDSEFLKFEIEKGKLRQQSMALIQGLPKSDFNDFLKLFYRNMNKRQYHIDSVNLDQNPLNFDLNILLSRYSKKVHRFYFKNSEADDEITKKVLDTISGYSYIDYLSVKNSINSQYHHNLLISALKNKKAIKHINLSSISLTEVFLNTLLQSFNSYNDRIRSLVLSKNLFSSSGCNILNNYLPGFTGLRDLNLSYNEINLEGITLLQVGLSQLKSLEELNIKKNSLRVEGIDVLMKSICYLPHLSVLNVSNNEGGDEGALVVAGYLKYMKVLMILYVDFVISPEVVGILCDCANRYTKIIKYNNREEMIVAKVSEFN